MLVKQIWELEAIFGKKINKIKQREFTYWQYVDTKQTPADIGSRCSLMSTVHDVWQKGPFWLRNSNEWSNHNQKETNFIIGTVANTVDTTNRFDLLLEKYELHKSLRI